MHFDINWIYVCNRLQLIAKDFFRKLNKVARGNLFQLTLVVQSMFSKMFTQKMPIRCVCRIWLLSCVSAICFHGFNIAESISPKLKNPTVTLYMQDFSLILHVFFGCCVLHTFAET